MKYNEYYDNELDEVITYGEFCDYGFCPCCSSPCWKPRKFKEVWFCKECCVSRLEDCAKIEKSFNQLLEDLSDKKESI